MVTLLVVIYIVFISLGLPDSLFGVVWPVLHKEFGIAESFASVYGIITGICTGFVSFLAGRLIRKFGTGRVTLVSIMLTAIGLLGMSFSPNIYVMMIFSIILGYGAGAIDTGLNNFVSLHFKSQHMNWLHCFWGIGVTLSPIIMSFFLKGESGSWRNGYRVIALIQLSIALIVLVTFNKWKIAESDDNKVDDKETKQKSLNPIQILKIKGVAPSILSLGLYCSMEFLVGSWGASYLVNVFSLPPDAAAKWISIYFLGITIGRFISGFISIKVNDTWMIRGGIIASLMGIIFMTLPIGKISIIGFLLVGIGFGPIFPSVLHSVPFRFGATYSADITGYHMGGAYAVGFMVQLAFGYIATATTFKITPFVLLMLCICLLLCSEFVVKIVNKNKEVLK